MHRPGDHPQSFPLGNLTDNNDTDCRETTTQQSTRATEGKSGPTKSTQGNAGLSSLAQPAAGPQPNEIRAKITCQCPRRSKPPIRPTGPPIPATEENRGKLEETLRQLYRSSAFNTCEHQQLPLMTGPPLRLMINKLATPKPHHNPIPVPIHWQAEVKAGLDRDVQLGVLEKVPIGTPVTWCHQMVTCT